MRFSHLLTATSAAVLLLACQPSEEAVTPNETVIVDTKIDTAGQVDLTAIPHAQLPETAIPQAYRIDMTIDPQADTMSGTVEIDVEIEEAGEHLWIHAKEMTVSMAQLRYSDATVDLTFDPISLAEAPSGLAKLVAERDLPDGSATLVIDYETPYNQNLNSAYQVKRGDDAYIVTQFEPLGAREAFPSFDEPKFKVPFTPVDYLAVRECRDFQHAQNGCRGWRRRGWPQLDDA